jgi:hypothetical protein
LLVVSKQDSNYGTLDDGLPWRLHGAQLRRNVLGSQALTHLFFAANHAKSPRQLCLNGKMPLKNAVTLKSFNKRRSKRNEMDFVAPWTRMTDLCL